MKNKQTFCAKLRLLLQGKPDQISSLENPLVDAFKDTWHLTFGYWDKTDVSRILSYDELISDSIVDIDWLVFVFLIVYYLQIV